MQCNRPSTTKLLRDLSITLSFHQPRIFNPDSTKFSLSSLRKPCLISSRSLTSSVRRKFADSLTGPDNDVNTSLWTEDATREMQHSFSTEQISRLASRAVRLAIQRNQIKEAYTIIQSLSQSMASYSSDNHDSTAFRKPALDFGVAVSPRLASHCLLHGLIRSGQLKQADNIIKFMWQMEYKIRTKSLEAVIHDLANHDRLLNGTTRSDQSSFNNTMSTIIKPDSFSEASLFVKDIYLSRALELVDAAKKYNRQRTRQMFSSLIDACLLQGEIIVAAFLFSFLVKQYLLKRQISAQVTELESSKQHDDLVVNCDCPPKARPARKPPFRHSDPFPELPFMNKIISYCEATLVAQNEGVSNSNLSINEAMQAIADLTYLLDEGLLPFSHVSSLIRALYTCPKDSHIRVFVNDGKGSYRSVLAHKYFVEVLHRLMLKLPTTKPAATNNRMLPPLDTRSYNSLIHHALRHRFSPALANMILEHMTKVRQPPLQPDVTTFNILLRGGTLLRRDDIVAQALSGLRQSSESVKHTSLDVDQRPPSKSSQSNLNMQDNLLKNTIPPIEQNNLQRNHSPPEHADKGVIGKPGKKRIRGVLSKISTEKFNFQVPQSGGKKRMRHIKADGFTLSSYIALLVARGNPEAVADLLFEIIPELFTTRDEENQKNLMRLLEYGPYFFVSILNALAKAGKTGLTERVWILAKQAEAASWDENHTEHGTAWCLPIHAYTIMMQLYASECKKGLRMRQLRREGDVVHLDIHRGMRPPTKDYALGWARQIYNQENESFGRVRAHVARDRALLLYRSMQSDAEQIHDSLKKFQGSRDWNALNLKGVQIPVPDARFFNAALYVFGRQSGMFKRNQATTSSRWRQKIRSLRRRYTNHGILPPTIDPMLLEILRAMNRAGYPIPIAYRRYLIGVWLSPSSEVKMMLSRGHSSHKGDLTKLTTPYYLITKKTRGLPIRRRTLRFRTRDCNA